MLVSCVSPIVEFMNGNNREREVWLKVETQMFSLVH